jgi:hypothetical protein
MLRAAETPWTGYAWNAAQQRYEFLSASYATWRDCIAATRKAANDVVPPSPTSQPFGCAHASNSYWKVWWNNDAGSGKPLAHDPEKCERFSDWIMRKIEDVEHQPFRWKRIVLQRASPARRRPMPPHSDRSIAPCCRARSRTETDGPASTDAYKPDPEIFSVR